INDEFNIGLERGESDSGTENEEDVVETSSGEDNDFTGQRGELGEALFKQCLYKSGLTTGSINNIIRSWRGSWRRHACSLSSFFEYWQQQGKTIEQLAETEKPYIIIVNYILMKLDSKHTDASIIQSQTSLSSQAEERDEGNLDQKQLMKIVLTLFMIYSVCRLAELQSARLDVIKQQEGIIIIKTNLGKGKSGDLEVTLSEVNNDKVCPVKWWRSWSDKRKLKNEWSQMQIWRNSNEGQNWTCDQCSKGIREIMRAAGIEKKYTVTSIRKASISAMIKLGKSKQEIDRWSRHSEAAATVRMLYDANNNIKKLDKMQSDDQIQTATNAIISFTDSFTKNKEIQQNEQYESDSEQTTSLTQVTSSLISLSFQIKNQTCNSVTQIPTLLQSLIELTRIRLGTHLNQEEDRLRLEVRRWSRQCLFFIQVYGNAQVQIEIVSYKHGRVISISFCTSGGIGEEQDAEIRNGLFRIKMFLKELHEGRNSSWQPSFHPLPLLARRTVEQIEEEGANEEIDAQLSNKGNGWTIKQRANEAKAATLNHFINWD
ncbi:MAG: hypothetical protein EZS28_027854, partial [Streblomastix strix]